MADITDPTQSPSVQDDSLAPGNGNNAQENRGIKRQRLSTAGDDDEDDDDKPGRERRKIDIKFIQDKSRRHITFSKRKAGIMKKVSWDTYSWRYSSSHGCNLEKAWSQLHIWKDLISWPNRD